MLAKNRWRRLVGAGLCGGLIAWGSFAVAHEHGERHAHESRYPRLSLQAQAVSEVPEDTVEIVLAAEIEGADQAEVARRLTERLNQTMSEAKKQTEIDVRNGAFRVWPNTDRDGKITAWRGRAEVVLESQNITRTAELAAELSNGMVISNVRFSLSPKARAAEEKRLLTEAAEAFSQRATDAAAAFGFEGFRVHKLDLGGSGAVYASRPEMAMMRAGYAADAAPPQLEPGRATVSVAVQGEVVLLTTP